MAPPNEERTVAERDEVQVPDEAVEDLELEEDDADDVTGGITKPVDKSSPPLGG